MPFITDFDVTYGNALAPAGFHRVTTREGGSANLNAVGSTSQSFLWTHEGANRGRPVVEVQVTYDSEPGPPGFQRVSRDLAKGGQSGRRAYLWLRRQSASVAESPSAGSRKSNGGSLSSSSSGRTQASGGGVITTPSRDNVDDHITHTKAAPPGPSRGDGDVSAPLVDVVVVFGQESDPNVAEAAEAAEQATTASTTVGKGGKAASRGPQRAWEKLDRSLNPGAMAGDAGAVYLWYRRGSDEDSPHCPSLSFAVGDWVDARDNAGIWRVAQVVSIGAEALRVQFPSKVEEDFAFESPELAKLGTFTPGRDTGQTNRRPGESWDIAPEQVRDMTRTLKTLCSTILEEESAPKVGGAALGSGGWRQGRERRFWEVELPAFIERCLSSSITDEEALPPIHELFLFMLEVIAVRMWQPAPMPRHLLQTLKRLGQDDRRCTWYYSTYGRPNSLLSYEVVSFNAGVGSTSLAERRPEWDRAVAQMPRGSIRAGFHSDASRLYVANLNHFARAGGFDALLSRMDLSKAEGLASLDEVATYVGVLVQGSRFFAPAWAEGYFDRVRRLIFGRLERLSNDELGGDDETVALVVKHMEVVLPTVLRDFNAAETVERFHLSFALQLLRCPLLNPRIRGVTLLSDIIDNTVRSSARRKSRGKGSVGMGTNVGYAYEWLDEEFLAGWLHDENVVEAVLGDPNPSGTTASSGGDPSKDKSDETSKKVHDTHVEVLKRADGLLGFMAHHDLLEAEHLDRLWDAGRGQPDAQVRAVFRLVEHICPRLEPTGLSVLYRHLRDLPPSYEEMHVELIRQFAESASRWGARGVSASPEREVSSGSSSQSIFGQGLELLWASIRDEAPVTAEVADQASEALADLLCHPSGPGRGYGYNNTAPTGSRLQSGMSYLGGGGGSGNATAAAAASEAELHAQRLMFFLDMCLENVEKGLSVAPSLRLMQRIIDAQPVSSAALGKPSGRRSAGGGAAGISGEGVAGMRKDEILVKLDEHKGLLRPLVEELLRYRRKARPAAREAGLLSNPDDRAASDTGAGGAAGDPLAAKLLGARLSHGEALGIRLDFIRFAVSNSPLELTFGLVETLWRDFLADPLCDSETEVFFAWMQSATPLPRPPQGGSAFVTMSSQVVHEVFRRLLCQEGGIPFDTMGLKGFWCLWRYFTVVNSEALAGSFAQKHHVVVEDFSSIQGLDTLWEAFLRSRNSAVVADAGDLLVQLHLRLAVAADEPRVWDSFIDRCMVTFESALHQVDQRTAPHDVLACERVLRLLIKFLDEIDRPRGGGSYSSASSNSSDGLILKVVVRGARNSNGAQTIREFNWALLKRSVTVGELRARISREVRHPANQVRVINSQRQLCPSPEFDSLLLEIAPIYSYCEAVLLDRPDDDTRGYVASKLSKSRPWDARLARKMPRHALANHDGYLETLFRLMEAGPEPLVEVAWALIQTLPVNTRIHEELESMGGRIILPTQTTSAQRSSGADEEMGYEGSGAVEASRGTSAESGAARQEPRWTRGKEGLPRTVKKERLRGSSSEVDWKTLLDGSQVLELLYRLQVVYTLVSAADDEYALPGDRADASVWRRVFLQTGGMRRLLSLLQQGGGIDPSRSLHKACLAKLLSLAAHFTTIKATTAAESFHVNFDPRLDRNDHLDVGDGGRGGDRGTSSGGLRPSSVEEAMEDTADMGTQVSTPRDWKEMVRELYADVNLPELVQRLLVVMHEVSKSALEAEKQANSTSAAGDGGGRSTDNEAAGFQGGGRGSAASGSETEGRSNTLPEAEVVQHTMALLCALAQLEPGLSEVIVSSPCLGSALSFSLLRTPELLVRKKVAEGVMNMAQMKLDKPSQEERVQAFLGLLLPLLPEVGLHESTCEYYFWLVASLVRHPHVLSVDEHCSLCIRLADLIASRPTVEESDEDEDTALYGYMSFLNNALAASPATLEGTIKARTGMDPAPPRGREDHTGAGMGRGRGRVKVEHGPLVETEGRGLVRELVEQCLFAVPPKRGSPLDNSAHGGEEFEDDEFEDVPPPKCKSRKTRLMAFKLLGQLARNCPSNLELIAELVGPHHHLGITSEENRNQGTGDKVNDSGATSYRSSGAGGAATSGMNDGEGGTWRTRGALAQPLVQIARHKSKTGFVGLKNMGCICYMNSTLQQLFMVPEFRQGVLAFRDGEESSEDGLMWHLQSLFSHLQESEKAYLDPGGLVRSLRDWEGRPLDVMLQQDASEFLTLFFQQVEGRVMGSPSENLLKHSFGGTYSNELLAERGLYSERPEPFSYISVEVKNMKTLDEALTVFTKEEVVSFKWDKDADPDTGERRAVTLSTRKRCSIKSLPEHLMIHLKRFDFDFDTMLQTKINERLEFPFQLNMFPYTKEGRAAAEAEAESAGAGAGAGAAGDAREGQELDSQLNEKKPEEYYLYNLAGVVVHMGTANSGHYYSYIRPRDGDGEWMEFNDTVVSNFDVKDMEAECFGGEETASYNQYSRSSGSSQMGPNGGSGMGGGSSWKRERTRNAFLLVYDRLLPQNRASNNQRQRQQQSDRSSSVSAPSPSASFQSSGTAPSDSDASCRAQEAPAVASTFSSAHPRVRPRTPSSEVQPGGGDVQRQKRRKRRKRFRAKIPAVFLQKIWRENVEFWRQKNVLEKDYYAFLDRLVVEDMQGRHMVPSTASLKLAVRFGLGTLVQARERDEMKRWTERLQAWLPLRPRACRWLLNEMFRSPTSLRELMLCHDDYVRDTAKKVLGTALNQAAISAGGGEDGDPSGKAYVEALDAVRDELQNRGLDDDAEDLGGGFVTVEQASSLPERGQENKQGERTSVLQSLWRRKGQAPRGDQGGSDKSEGERAKKKRGSTPELEDDDNAEAKTAYAISVVRFAEACLGLLSVAPGIDQPDWYVSGHLLRLLQNFAETGPSERCHLLKRRALATLLLMCLGDSPSARRKERPLAQRVGSHGEAESSTVSNCPPSPTSSGFAVDEPDAISVASSRGRTGGTGVGVGMDGAIEEDSKTTGYRVTNKDLRQSALLQTIAPLLLSSELSRDGDDMASGGADSNRVAGGHSKLAPSTLLPLVKTTRREEEMLLSKALRIRLIYLLQGPREKKLAVGLMQHFCWRNELMSKMMIHNICECIEVPHDEDAPQTKPAFRALAVILNQVPDGLEQWRIELAMPKVLQTIKDHRNLRAVTEQALEMFVRLAKASVAVRKWLAARPESIEWVERWLINMGHAKRQDPRKTQRTGGSSLRDGYGGTAITAPVGPSRVYGLRGNGPPTSVTEDQVCPVPWHETTLEMIRAIVDGQDFVSYGYDSDDEPSSLVGKRIEVKWKGNSWYGGEVMSYDSEKETHRVLYDDGDDKRYNMGVKTWRILLPAGRI